MAEDVRIDRAALGQLLASPTGAVAKDLERRALSIEGAAKRLCPVDTGRLRSSITHALGVDVQGLKADIGSDVEYAVYVELGTSRAAAQPFLRPALIERGST